MRILVALDPGADTGMAEYLPDTGDFEAMSTVPIHVAMLRVRDLSMSGQLMGVVFEDARRRTWFGAYDEKVKRFGAGVREGAGAAKRDAAIWQSFLTDLGCRFASVKPQSGATKWGAQMFSSMTGWKGRTSNHARDAALLVWGMSRHQADELLRTGGCTDESSALPTLKQRGCGTPGTKSRSRAGRIQPRSSKD